jgi:hypothetical protein
MNEVRQVLAGVNFHRPAPARIYDYLLGGENNFQADRDAAERILALAPEIRDCAWANRGFHQRAARWIARRGIRQFIDVGSGLPTVGNTHEVVQLVDRRCRVVYADNDPMVPEQASHLLTDTTRVQVILADLREPDSLLENPDVRALIDFSQPTGLLMTAVLHFVADERNPWGLVARYLDVLAPGSYMSLSHLTADHKPPRAVQGFRRVFDQATEQIDFRSKLEIERFFAGLELVPPHADAERVLCHAGDWEADVPALADTDGSRWLYCGVARRP